jgi:putative phosphoribosyl transferase
MINQMYQSGKGATALMIGAALSGVNVVEVLYTQTAAERYTRCKISCLTPKGYQKLNRQIEPFPNLSSGGDELARRLVGAGINHEMTVLGIVSAGIPVAAEVAKHLEAALDVVIIRRLLAPRGPGSQAVAINAAGTLVIDEEIEPRPAQPQTPFEYFMEDALNGLALRAKACRGERPPADLAGRSVLIVDCGIRTGLTMQAAIGAVRTLNPARITVAVPVTSIDGRQVVEALADEFICLAEPEPFGNAGVWYRDFRRPADDSISQLLRPSPKLATTPG